MVLDPSPPPLGTAQLAVVLELHVCHDSFIFVNIFPFLVRIYIRCVAGGDGSSAHSASAHEPGMLQRVAACCSVLQRVAAC